MAAWESYQFTFENGKFQQRPSTACCSILSNELVSFTIHYQANAVVLDQFARNPNFAAPRIVPEQGGGWRTTFTGNPNRTYAIQFTPGLLPANWQTLGTATADAQGGCFSIDVPPAGTARCFYRSVVP